MAAAGLLLGPAAALAQTAPATTAAPPPATDTVGPRELQNFNLNGTVTKPAETPAPAPSRAAPVRTPAPGRTTASDGPPRAVATASAAPRRATAPGAETAQVSAPTANSSSDAAPAFGQPTPAATAPVPGFAPSPEFTPAAAPEPKSLLWPWLLLALAIGAAGAFLLWRRRAPEAYADGPEYGAQLAPEPTPRPVPRTAVPVPAPAPAPAPEPSRPVGIVSSTLRPWLDIAFAPVGCTVDDDRVIVEFDAQVTNNGSAPARDILIEASMFNAGPTQDQDIGTFFANPVGQGERIAVIAPLAQVTIRSSLIAPRQNIQLFELGGHQVFVPLIAFNALYRQSAGPAQTSSAYLLGRETKTDKLGPFRADLGPKAFGNLGTRPLPMGVRT